MERGGVVTRNTLLTLFVWSVVLTAAAFAADTDSAAAGGADLGAQVDAAQARLDAAQKRVDELEKKVGAMEGSLGATRAQAGDLSSQLAGLEEKARATGEAKPAVQFVPYGQLKVDVIHDNAQMNSTDDGAYVLQEKPGFANDRQFGITVRQTTFGVNILTPDVWGCKSRGKIEMDFYGQATVENKETPRLRYAYWELVNPTWSVLVGQAQDVFGPLAANTVNRPKLDNSGNIGYRRPMVRYEKLFKLPDEKLVQMDFALARMTGGTVVSSSSLDDAGSDAGWPLVESRAGFCIPTKFKRAAAIGVGGHIGQEEMNPTAGTPPVVVSGHGAMFMTYCGVIDWTTPLADKIDISGEFFKGRNLDSFQGGIGQGVNTTLGVPIDAIGGWAQLQYRPVKAWTFDIGGGIDDPENSDLNAGDRGRNATCFANAIYGFSDKFSVGVEAAFIRTDYLAGPDGDNVRVQAAAMYKL